MTTAPVNDKIAVAKAFVATCGEITNGGGAFADASCDSTGAARVYDATTSAATTPNDANCCKAKALAEDRGKPLAPVWVSVIVAVCVVISYFIGAKLMILGPYKFLGKWDVQNPAEGNGLFLLVVVTAVFWALSWGIAAKVESDAE